MTGGVKVLDLSEERMPALRQAVLRDIGNIVLNTLGVICLSIAVLRDQYSTGTLTMSMPELVLTWASFGWYLLEVVTMLTNEKRRAVHDLIANAVVVSRRIQHQRPCAARA